MNEDSEVKAPVTRLRRRISVEQSEDGKSPVLSTPTKKRGGRKVAKPELDLIDENVAESNLKKTTKKNIPKDIAEIMEDKPITPSRRSARIKSNTSIVSDTVQNVDSPRAKRAARRTSQVGSDSEMSLTPARQTRRTRKDSTSSIEKHVDAAVNRTQIPEVINEEPENAAKSISIESKTLDNESTTPTPLRQSPRLLNKKSRLSNSSAPDENKNSSLDSNNDLFNTSDLNKSKTDEPVKLTDANMDNVNDAEISNYNKNRLSVSSSNLIINMENKPKKIYSHINKSLSEAQDMKRTKPKRHRTKSWTTITSTTSVHDDFYSDTEITKKKNLDKLGNITKKKPSVSGSGDSKHNDDYNDNENSSQKKIPSSGKKKNKDIIPKQSHNESEMTKLFQNEPNTIIQTTIVMEDSDSNPMQINVSKNDDITDDQCVPVVDQIEKKGNESSDYTLSTSFNKNKSQCNGSKVVGANVTCEPMDIDETLPESLPNNVPTKEKNQEKILFTNSLDTSRSMMMQTSNRFLSNGLSTSQNLEKSNVENKSTLILSQLKYLSESENKSPKILKNEELSQSINALNVTQENEKRKRVSLNYLTSTPLQQKSDSGDRGKEKSNNIFDNNTSKNKGNITPKKNVSAIANKPEQSSESDSDSENELKTNKNSSLLDNEAEEVSDKYESGDSQDEEERQYERDNEIVEKGETLTTEDELSNDSDYEKDSFLVTSDDEDNELLSGSGDDLSMSDKELKMNPESKKKYNARKLKEQKQASREMFEARHKLNTFKNNRSLKLPKTRQNSSEDLDSSKSDDEIMGSKKNKRMRLNSTTTESINKSNIEDSDNKKKEMDSYESMYNETLLKEKEISICEIAPNIRDPLTLHLNEASTPVREHKISVGFIDVEEQKDTPNNKNTSSRSLKTQDPLDVSDNDDSSSLNTEDENIARNYDNVLNDLRTKTANHSLNLEKKSKTKSNSNISIINNLNLTQTKPFNTLNDKSSHKENTFNSANNTTSNNASTNLNEESRKNCENWPFTNSLIESSEYKEKSLVNEDEPSTNKNAKNSKFTDLSLNLDRKSKKSTNKPLLLDQLNLTQGNKKSKKDCEKGKPDKIYTTENLNQDNSSDSIDLKLLFSEDSINSSDLNKENTKNSIRKEQESLIPLKKSEGKTDIRAKKDLIKNENADAPFFVDTIGDHSESSRYEEKVYEKITNNASQRSDDTSESSDEPLEIAYKKENSNGRRKKNNKTIDADEIDIATESLTAKSLLKAPQGEKTPKKTLSQNVSHIESFLTDSSLHKKNKSDEKRKETSDSFNVSNLDVLFSTENIIQSINNKSISKTPDSEKKKTKKLSKSNISEIEHPKLEINTSNTKTPNSEKKKRKKLSESFTISEVENAETFNLIDKMSFESMNKEISEKKKKHLSQSKNFETDVEINIIKTIETTDEIATNQDNNTSNKISKKRKRSSTMTSFDVALEDDTSNTITANVSMINTKKKLKLSQKSDDNNTTDVLIVNEEIENEATQDNVFDMSAEKLIESQMSESKKKVLSNKQFKHLSADLKIDTKGNVPNAKDLHYKDDADSVKTKTNADKYKKRKNREDDIDANKALKVRKENSFDHIHISRLPPSILTQLDDKPNKNKNNNRKHKVISTTEFVVEETRKRRNKPSNYLEESIYINDNDLLEEKKQKGVIKKPKVLPFIPTAATSNSGYTSNFKVNVIPQEIKFVAQSNIVNSFKNEYLYGKKIKRLGTYDLYKKNRNIKISKF